ncbi:MAG: hypothetical protein IH855_07790, partial [Bacteroidetes bacterium]|nr:hypothetical protein [Bacteroidota bacterium]
AENPPTFIEAYWMGIETLRREGNNGSDWYYVPDADELNEIAVTHKLGYVLEPPDLKLRSGEATVIEVDERPTSLSDEAFDQFERSISRAEELLREGRGREAVQESLWLLESFSLSFRGLDIEGTTIAGKYFNRIADELRKSSNGGTREMAMDWMTKLHGYLSSPTGGGVRHGADLSSSISMNPYEARLFCNLIRSYISYLIEEHAQFEAEPTPTKF